MAHHHGPNPGRAMIRLGITAALIGVAGSAFGGGRGQQSSSSRHTFIPKPTGGEPGGQKPVSIVPITAPIAPEVGDSPAAVTAAPAAPTTAPAAAGVSVGSKPDQARTTPLTAVSAAIVHDADVQNSVKDLPQPSVLRRTP